MHEHCFGLWISLRWVAVWQHVLWCKQHGVEHVNWLLSSHAVLGRFGPNVRQLLSNAGLRDLALQLSHNVSDATYRRALGITHDYSAFPAADLVLRAYLSNSAADLVPTDVVRALVVQRAHDTVVRLAHDIVPDCRANGAHVIDAVRIANRTSYGESCSVVLEWLLRRGARRADGYCQVPLDCCMQRDLGGRARHATNRE